MTNINILCLILFILFIQQSMTHIPPVVPLTNALTAIYCHNSNQAGIMTIRCPSNEKIRMLDAFDVVVKNKSHLPLQCLKQLQQPRLLMNNNENSNNIDCKVHTSFTSACSGRENCTLHMQRIRLNSVNAHCHNELVDYTMAFFECISDVFIHDVCSSQAITSAWGTLKTPNFPNPYTSNDDCWCKLSTQNQHRILLSVIIFQLIPFDQKCAGAGLYLQSSDEQRSTQCTYLQQGHNYLSDTNSLYVNFYSRTSTVRGGFWIVYEASHPNAEVHLHCGQREQIGIPIEKMSITPSPISSSYNHGWSRLPFNNPTTKHMMNKHLFGVTPRSFLDTNFKKNPSTTSISAFTYPYGHLTTFELAYGPRGWFLKYPFGLSNITATEFLQRTTTRSPVVKWNSTWRYIRRLKPKVFITTSTTTTTTTKTTTTTVSTTTRTTTLESTITPMIMTTEQKTIPSSSIAIYMTTFESVTAEQRLLFTQNPRMHHSSNSTKSSTTTTTKPTTKSTIVTLETTLPSPTPWYPPAGPFDWWQWQWYTTRSKQASSEIVTTTHTTTIKSTIHLTNKTDRPIITNQNKTTVDWFQWPHTAFTTTPKGRPDFYEEEDFDWPDYFVTTKIQPTKIPNILASILSEQQRQKFQQMSFSSTKSNWQFYNQAVTINTPPSKRYDTQHNTLGAGERNAAGIPSNTQYINQQVTDQQNKKPTEQFELLSKTDITIVAVSILFIILLFIINLIVFAIRRHRHRLQNRHFLSASIPFSLNDRQTMSNEKFSNSTHSLINTTNNNNNDILPAVGEIVLWDEKDQGGYTIDKRGEWEKIEGSQWFGGNLLKNCSKTSFSKSFRSRFQFFRQSKKRLNYHQQLPTITQQKSLKYPLHMDNAMLSSVCEADDYQISEFSSELPQTRKTIQALIHTDQDQSDDYYKRIEMNCDESNYSMNNRNEGSVIISVPTMLRQDDDNGITTDTGESIYNQHYSIGKNSNTKQSVKINKAPRNNSYFVGHCQTDFVGLDPKLLVKSLDKSLLAEHQQFYNCSPSFQLSTYDSGFFDDQTMDNLTKSTAILSDKSEKKSKNQTKTNEQRHIAKHVSFHS